MASKYKYPDVLRRFIDEQFDVDELIAVGLLNPEDYGDYPVIADKICKYFGFESIFEYGAREISCHITYQGDRGDKPFVETFPSIYD